MMKKKIENRKNQNQGFDRDFPLYFCKLRCYYSIKLLTFTENFECIPKNGENFKGLSNVSC